MTEKEEKGMCELTVENAYYIHSLMKLLLAKGIVTEEEINRECAVIKMELETDDLRKIN